MWKSLSSNCTSLWPSSVLWRDLCFDALCLVIRKMCFFRLVPKNQLDKEGRDSLTWKDVPLLQLFCCRPLTQPPEETNQCWLLISKRESVCRWRDSQQHDLRLEITARLCQMNLSHPFPVPYRVSVVPIRFLSSNHCSLLFQLVLSWFSLASLSSLSRLSSFRANVSFRFTRLAKPPALNIKCC